MAAADARRVRAGARRAAVERIKAINPYAQTPDGQGSSFFDGWHGYLDKDLRRLLGGA